MSSLLLLFLGSSCKKNSIRNQDSEIKYSTLPEVKKVLMEKIIYMAKNNPQFKKTVENECLKQVRGDYNVALEKIIEIDQQNPILSETERNIFISLVQQMKDFRPHEMPIIFVPVMENRDPNDINSNNSKNSEKKISISSNSHNYITMVDQDNEVGTFLSSSNNNMATPNYIAPIDPGNGGGGGPQPCVPPYFYSGYIISDAGTLTFKLYQRRSSLEYRRLGIRV